MRQRWHGCARPAGGESGDQGDFTLDTLILLSLHSPELEARVAQRYGPLFEGPNGERRRSGTLGVV